MSNQAVNASQEDLVFRGPGKRVGSRLGTATQLVSRKFQHRRVHCELEEPQIMVHQTDNEFVSRNTGRTRRRTQHQLRQLSSFRLADGILQHNTTIRSDGRNGLLDII